MSCLYILGRAGSFRSYRALCHISSLVVRLFYRLFLDMFMATKDDYVSIPKILKSSVKLQATSMPSGFLVDVD
jgi:hypothetical protein